MSSPFGMYGGAGYASPESRALGSITKESYDYRDQGKTLSKLVVDVSYLAGMQRKMQKGIDDANQNFIQQIQSLINDLIAIFSGGGDTGFDFGDLKYLLQALGALFGLEPGMPFPINLFNAAWHFFSNYILPINNFEEVINLIVDGIIATALDIFGEVPILGEALQQLAVIISNVRDGLLSVWDFIDTIFDAIGNILEFLFGWIDLENILTGTWDIVEGIATFISNVVEWGLLAIFSPLDAFNLFGTPPKSLFDNVPLSSVTDDTANYLANPYFVTDDSVADSIDWFHDATKFFNGVDSPEDAGSVWVEADGFPHELYGSAMTVKPGQKIHMSMMTDWESLTGTGNPVQMWVAYGYKGQEVHTELLDSETIHIATTPDWLELSGETTVPEELDGNYIDIDEVRMLLKVTETATSGTVWFSYGDMGKDLPPRVAPISWIKNLPEMFQGIDEFVQGVIDIVLEVVEGVFTFGGTLDDAFAALWEWFEDGLATAAQAGDALLTALGINRILTRIFNGVEDPGLAAADEAVTALNGRIVALEGGGVITTYTVSGTWTNPTPTEHKRIKVICIGGGDGGDRPSSTFYDQARGGRSGGYVERELWTDEIPATVAMTIGMGGAGAGFGGGTGGVGTNTTFGSIVLGQKGVGAIYKDGAKLPERGAPPGDGGNGVYWLGSDTGSPIPASHGIGGAFAAGGRAGFGDTVSAVTGKNGDAAPVNTPSGGGGGGGASAYTTNQGVGGNGGFPGGGGGGGARRGNIYGDGGNGAQGCIYVVTED